MISEEPELFTIAAADGYDLLAAAESDWSRPIPHCPGWSAADLVGHTGSILAWIATIVTTRNQVARRDRETPPAETIALSSWYSGRLERALDVLTATPADTATWTFSTLGHNQVGWWRRRLAVELAIHRWDAQHAASIENPGPPAPLDAAIAAAGIEEFLTEFLPDMLARAEINSLTGTLRLHASDGSNDWWVDLDSGTAGPAVPGHERPDTTIYGVGSDLLLWLTNRSPTPSISIHGRHDHVVGWTELRR
jgi:uncharacterized protein (TIGR03083 family)